MSVSWRELARDLANRLRCWAGRAVIAGLRGAVQRAGAGAGRALGRGPLAHGGGDGSRRGAERVGVGSPGAGDLLGGLRSWSGAAGRRDRVPGVHGWQLLGSDVRVTGLRGSRDAAPREIAEMRLIDELAAVGQGAGQVGIGWRDVERLVPRTQALVNVALEVRDGVLGGRSPRRSMEVAGPALRIDDPVVELGDRLARLYRVTWQLTSERQVGVGTLADFAAAGVFLHEHGSRLVRHVSGSEPDLDGGLSRWLRPSGAVWRSVHLQLRQLRRAISPIRGVSADVLAIGHLLERVGPLSPREQGKGAGRRLESAIFGGARSFTDVTRWSAEVLDNLVRSGQLYVRGRLLTGGAVTDDPTLVQAKLADRTTTATKDRVVLVRTACQAAQGPGLGCGASGAPFLDGKTPPIGFP